MVTQAISSSTVFGVPRGTFWWRWLFGAGSATCFSGSKLSRHCILAKHVLVQYRTGLDEMRLVSGADLRRLRIPYERITVYKITGPSVRNDVYRTGRFHFGSAHRPVDGVDICRELYAYNSSP